MTGGPILKKLNQWIDRFAYSHPRFGIPNLMLYIVIANAVTYILTLFAGSAALSFLKFDLYHVLHGEVPPDRWHYYNRSCQKSHL